MAKNNIDIGTAGNPATGDSLRGAFAKVNATFDDIYTAIGDPSTGLYTTALTNGDVKLQPNGAGVVEIDQLQINSSAITSTTTNTTVSLTGNGTGGVQVEEVLFKDSTISSVDSLSININDGVIIDGPLTVNGEFALNDLVVGTLNVDNLNFNDNIISSDSNADIILTPGGTGDVVAGAIRIHGTSLSADDSSTININDGLILDGALTVSGAFDLEGLAVGTLEVDNLNFNDNIISSDTNADINIAPGGTGNLVLDTDLVSVGGGSEVGHISSNGAFNLLLSTNGDTDSGSIEIVDGANGDITIENNGTGDILLKAGGQVGIGSVSSPDTSLHIKSAAAKITLQRTADANTPGLSLQNSGGNVRAELMMDGSSGTSNTVFVKTYDGSSLAERFRVTHTGATVTGTLDIDSGISITDNTITTSASNANLEINASGSGTVVLENLKVGTGSTVTTILDEDAMGSDSATALATQQSIKAYVDSTVTAQDLDFQGDSGGALNIDLDSETLDIAGGTNINTAGSGNTLTVNLDTALTGLTSVVVDNVTIADNTITTNASNANLELSANGSGIVTIDGGIDIGDINISYGTATTTSSSAANMDTFAAATFRSAKYQVSIVDSTNTRFGIYEIFVTHDGSSAYINAVGISDTGEDLATFSADIDSGSVRVRVVPVSDASTVFKFVRTVFAV